MATIVNNPPAYSESSSGHGMGFLAGVLLLIVMLFLLFFYGLPVIRSAVSGPSLSVPSKIDVNVNTPPNGGGQPQQNQ